MFFQDKLICSKRKKYPYSYKSHYAKNGEMLSAGNIPRQSNTIMGSAGIIKQKNINTPYFLGYEESKTPIKYIIMPSSDLQSRDIIVNIMVKQIEMFSTLFKINSTLYLRNGNRVIINGDGISYFFWSN